MTQALSSAEGLWQAPNLEQGPSPATTVSPVGPSASLSVLSTGPAQQLRGWSPACGSTVLACFLPASLSDLGIGG